MKLLTVDDSAMVRKIIANTGAAMGYDVLEAENGEHALEILKKEYAGISLVLLDWNMPGMNGLDVLGKIKSDERLTGVPVMMVTTESERESVLLAIQKGADNYLSKPFAVEDLIAKIMQTARNR